MKAVVWLGPRQMELQDVPSPAPGKGKVVVRVGAVGICGSELSGYLGQSSLRIPPLVMGAAGKVQPAAAWLEERGLAACAGAFAQLIDAPPAVAKIVLRP